MTIKPWQDRYNNNTISVEQAMQAEINELREENARLLAANSDCVDHFHQMRDDLEAAQAKLAEQDCAYMEGFEAAKHEARDAYNELRQKNTKQLGQLAEQSASMSMLLARIHRDGGQYEAEHGTEKAVIDAGVKVAQAYSDLFESQQKLQELENQEPVAWMTGPHNATTMPLFFKTQAAALGWCSEATPLYLDAAAIRNLK